MKIVLADIEQSDLIQAENYFRAEGADVISIVTDVSKANDVEALAQKNTGLFWRYSSAL